MDTGEGPLMSTKLPGCPYRMTSHTGPRIADTDLAFDIQVHRPRFLEHIGAPESARLLNHSPDFWIQHMTPADAIAAAVNLQRDAGLILCQFVFSLQRMSLEVLSLAVYQVPFPMPVVAALSHTPRAPRAAQYMLGMGLCQRMAGPMDLNLSRRCPAMIVGTADTVPRSDRPLPEHD